MNSIRVNYNKCGEKSFNAFIKTINGNSVFVFKAHNPADSSVTQDRYTYNKGKCRVSIVYETKAQTLIITAPQNVIRDIEALLPVELTENSVAKELRPQSTGVEGQRSDAKKADIKKTDIKKADTKREEAKAAPARDNKKGPDKQNASANSVSENKQNKQNKRAQKDAKNASEAVSVKAPEKHNEKKQQEQSQAKKAPINIENTQKDRPLSNQTGKEKQQKPQREKSGKKNEVKADKSFIIKKVSAEKFAELLKKIKAHKDMRYRLMPDDKAYLITFHSEKAIIKHLDDSLELSGSQGDLFSELQLMTSGASDYKTAINSHIKQMGDGKRPSEVERQLKKLLPAAFEFLSEQSKIDLAIGVIDINNSAVVLSDYSTLLIPCFRGLERLIFDLQHAQGIVVKMIGQAYEKEDGNYVLKSGYRRKIPSVIYAEVMASLYTEYFKHRNFYAHSDGGYDNVSRIISDKQQVQAIFNRILEVINYNGKKLKEIGFRI